MTDCDRASPKAKKPIKFMALWPLPPLLQAFENVGSAGNEVRRPGVWTCWKVVCQGVKGCGGVGTDEGQDMRDASLI